MEDVIKELCAVLLGCDTLAQVKVILSLLCAGRCESVSELARTIGMTRANTHKAVMSLVDAGHISRVQGLALNASRYGKCIETIHGKCIETIRKQYPCRDEVCRMMRKYKLNAYRMRSACNGYMRSNYASLDEYLHKRRNKYKGSLSIKRRVRQAIADRWLETLK